MKKEDKENGWKSAEEKETFDKFYESDCKSCHSISCIVKGGWRSPCFIKSDGTNKLLNKPI